MGFPEFYTPLWICFGTLNVVLPGVPLHQHQVFSLFGGAAACVVSPQIYSPQFARRGFETHLGPGKKFSGGVGPPPRGLYPSKQRGGGTPSLCLVVLSLTTALGRNNYSAAPSQVVVCGKKVVVSLVSTTPRRFLRRGWSPAQGC